MNDQDLQYFPRTVRCSSCSEKHMYMDKCRLINASIKVPISCLGILRIYNLCILLRKNITHLVVQKYHLHAWTFPLSKLLPEMTSQQAQVDKAQQLTQCDKTFFMENNLLRAQALIIARTNGWKSKRICQLRGFIWYQNTSNASQPFKWLLSLI